MTSQRILPPGGIAAALGSGVPGGAGRGLGQAANRWLRTRGKARRHSPVVANTAIAPELTACCWSLAVLENN